MMDRLDRQREKYLKLKSTEFFSSRKIEVEDVTATIHYNYTF